MKKKVLIICLVLFLLTSGCGRETGYAFGKSMGMSHRQSFPFLPNEIGVFPMLVPAIFGVMKNINELNAMIEFERKADAEFAEMKNPIWFVKIKERQGVK